MLKPPKFDGQGSFETFWAKFKNCARHNQWSRAQELVYLKSSLENDVANVLWDYGTEVTDSLSGLTRVLQKRFGGKDFVDKHRIEMRNRRRKPNESLQELHSDIRRLAALAFPKLDHTTCESIACDYFMEALADSELIFKIRERQPTNLDAAYRIAQQFELWAQDSERLRTTGATHDREEKEYLKRIREVLSLIHI